MIMASVTVQVRGCSFTQDGVVSSTLLWLRCSKCNARHYYSYAVGGDVLPTGTTQVYPGWADAKYTHVTDESVFETRTLKRYREQCLHSDTSFFAFSKEYASLSIYPTAVEPKTWAKRLAHSWRAFELVTCLQEMPEGCSNPLLLPLSDETKLDSFLLANTPRMLHQHIRQWGQCTPT